jgi:hypothetical protein
VRITLARSCANHAKMQAETGQTANEYLEELRSWVDTIEYHGGSVAESYKLAPEKSSDGTPYSIAKRTIGARDKTLGIDLIQGADPTRYSTLITELSNQFAMGKDDYPDDLTAAYNLLVNYKTPTNATSRPRPTTGQPSTNTHLYTSEPPLASSVTLAQKLGPTPGNDGLVHPTITFYQCNQPGHYANTCPSPSPIPSVPSGTALVTYVLAQATSTAIGPRCILLDSQSTKSVFMNPDLLSGIRPSPYTLRALTNGGHQDSHLIGDFPVLGAVWFNPSSIANILSLSYVRKLCRVTMDTSHDCFMVVHRIDGSLMHFQEHASGLYVFDPEAHEPTVTRTSGITLLSTVTTNKRLFSPRHITAADAARRLYRLIGRPSEAEFQRILRNNLVRNCPITPLEATRAFRIDGPDIAVVKGKTTKGTVSPRAPTSIASPLSPPILAEHRNVTLCVVFFYPR